MEPSANGMSTYFVHHYDGTDVSRRTATRAEIQSLRPEEVDHFVNLPFMQFEYRDREGIWRSHDWSHLGDVTLALLEVLQRHPGEYLPSYEIAQETGYWTLNEHTTLSQRLKWLRKIHFENPQAPQFFLSKRNGSFAIAWSAARTWMRIEKELAASPAAHA